MIRGLNPWKGKKIFYSQTGSMAQSASCWTGIGLILCESKSAGMWIWTHELRARERKELHLCSFCYLVYAFLEWI